MMMIHIHNILNISIFYSIIYRINRYYNYYYLKFSFLKEYISKFSCLNKVEIYCTGTERREFPQA